MTNVPISAVYSLIDSAPLPSDQKVDLKARVLTAAAPLPDTWIYRIVVLALGLAIFVPLAGLFVCDKAGDPKGALVQMLLPIATAALGALAGLLAPSPARNG
jgi:hypothetical protein